MSLFLLSPRPPQSFLTNLERAGDRRYKVKVGRWAKTTSRWGGEIRKTDLSEVIEEGKKEKLRKYPTVIFYKLYQYFPHTHTHTNKQSLLSKCVPSCKNQTAKYALHHKTAQLSFTHTHTHGGGEIMTTGCEVHICRIEPFMFWWNTSS